jgi:hypothetical protein
MAEIRLPLSIVYKTEGVTPISDVVAALGATEAMVKDAVSLLPSLYEGLCVEESSLNVRSLTQESPLREYFLLALVVTFQDDLTEEVSPVIEDLFKITIDDKYDTIVTILFMIVVFYGAGLAVDLVKRAVSDSLPRAKYEELIELLALETGKPVSDLRQIIHAKFEKPSSVRRLVGQSKQLFLPSQKSKNAPVSFDRDLIPSDTVRDIPYAGDGDEKQDFDRYDPHYFVELELHAQDKDKSATGWAAVASEISKDRLKVKVIDPVQPSDLWGNDFVTADIVVVSKLTSDGFKPFEIQVTQVHPNSESHVSLEHPETE